MASLFHNMSLPHPPSMTSYCHDILLSMPFPCIPAYPLLHPMAAAPCSLPAGTADSSVLNVAQLPVLAHSECNSALRGRLKESELCTAPLRAGVGACEVSWAGDIHPREVAGVAPG